MPGRFAFEKVFFLLPKHLSEPARSLRAVFERGVVCFDGYLSNLYTHLHSTNVKRRKHTHGIQTFALLPLPQPIREKLTWLQDLRSIYKR